MSSKTIQLYKDGQPAYPVTCTENIVNSEGESLETTLGRKQDVLVSGSNVKTVNGETIVGSGNLSIDTSSAVWGNVSGDVSDLVDLIVMMQLEISENAVAKVNTANKIYGTDSNGAQTTYDTTALGSQVIIRRY